jgi:Ca2+/H+ antiporter
LDQSEQSSTCAIKLEPAHGTGCQASSAITSGDEADTDGEISGRHCRVVNFKDTEKDKASTSKSDRKRKKKHKHQRKHAQNGDPEKEATITHNATTGSAEGKRPVASNNPQVSFIEPIPEVQRQQQSKSPFNLRNLRPTLSKSLAAGALQVPQVPGMAGPSTPRASYGIRRTNSLPERLNEVSIALSAQPLPHIMPAAVSHLSLDPKEARKVKQHISRPTAIVLLLVSTGLVAVCAEFLVGSIREMVLNTGVSETFVGLIILPIVGNAAEHVTAVTVASKNKMDLAIGVAVGSSIQIGMCIFFYAFLFLTEFTRTNGLV